MQQAPPASSTNRNSINRLSLNMVPSSPLQQQSPMHTYHPPQPSWWNNGLGLGIGGGARRNSNSNFSLTDIEESMYNNRMNINNNNQYYYTDSQVINGPMNRGSIGGSEMSVPTIQIDSTPNLPSNGYMYSGTGSSPTHPTSSPTQPFHRTRANSSITAARNKLRIMAMLDDVRKKRELRDRRKSDIMAYLDDLIVPDDPAMANAAGALKIYRRRFKIYQFLNHPSTGTPWSITYHVMVFVIVFVCLILTICATIQQAPLQEKAIKSVYMLEKVVVVWFNIEFGLGLWSCACKKRYRGVMGKVRYLTVPSRLIDLVILSFTTVVLIFNPSKTGHEVFVISAFRGFHRFFQVAQVLTLNRPLKPWKVLASVIYDQREQLFIIYYTEFIVLCVLAYVAFLVERDTNENFNSIADAMWWAIVTLSTVGYGDRVPVTWIGKIISTMFTILGVAIFALPAGIIGTGLALKIEEVERNQIRNRKKVAAAILIQRAYRSWKAHTTYELVSKFFRERPMPIYKQHDYLSMAQKFIALVQFLIALNKFRELLRPLDLKTVMQSYSDGQTEVLLRTKLVQQSIEELARRVEMTENRVANMSMRIETKQNTFERRIDHIRQLMESCHRQLLANHLLVELLRTNNNRYQGSTMTTGRRQPSSRQLSINRQSFLLNNRPKTATINSSSASNNNNNNKTATTSTMTVPTNMTLNNQLKVVSSVPSIEISDHSTKQQQQEQKPCSSATSNKQQQSTIITLKPIKHNQNLMQTKKDLYPITSSGSNTSIDDIDEEDLVIGYNQSQHHTNQMNQGPRVADSSTIVPSSVSNRQNINHNFQHNHHHFPHHHQHQHQHHHSYRPRRMSL